MANIAKREGVQIKLYAIIYELIDEVKDAMAGLLPPVEKEVTTGQAEVRQLFDLSKGGTVAGCFVKSGVQMNPNATVDDFVEGDMIECYTIEHVKQSL